jgi:hypothetical protein
VVLSFAEGCGGFEVGHQVVKEAGERWPVDATRAARTAGTPPVT